MANTKLSELTVDASVVKKGEKISYVNKTQMVYRIKAYEWLELNVRDLITAVDQYLRTYNNPKRIIKSGGLIERRNKRMIKIHKYLQEFEKKRE